MGSVCAALQTAAADDSDPYDIMPEGSMHFSKADPPVCVHRPNRSSELLDYRSSIYHTSSVTRRVSDKPMPAASIYILLALLGGENHGYSLMRLVEEQSQGSVRMGPGTLYGTLNRLLIDGLIVETTDDTDRAGNERRRYYRLSQEGNRIALLELDRLRTLVRRFAGITGPSGGINIGGAPA